MERSEDRMLCRQATTSAIQRQHYPNRQIYQVQDWQPRNPLTNSWLFFVTHARERLSETETRSTAGRNSLSNLWFFSFETHEHGTFTDSIVYPSRRAFKVAKFSSSKQPGRYGLVP